MAGNVLCLFLNSVDVPIKFSYFFFIILVKKSKVLVFVHFRTRVERSFPSAEYTIQASFSSDIRIVDNGSRWMSRAGVCKRKSVCELRTE